jgi:hypothetical protein
LGQLRVGGWIVKNRTVKNFLVMVSMLFLILPISRGEEMNIAEIKSFAKQIDDSLARGRIYHINYSFVETRTDFYYAYYQEMIERLESNPAESIKNIHSVRSDGQVIPQEEAYVSMLNSMKKKLTDSRQHSGNFDYMVDGTSFYMTQDTTWISAKGVARKGDSAIFASDGKIMGSFYPDDGQGTLQPATERPPVPERHWNEYAYDFWWESLTDTVASMDTLKLGESNGKVLITGESPDEGLKTTKLEFRIDKASLRPEEITILNYDKFGNLNRKLVKRWEYQDFSGITLPKRVVDETYLTGLDKQNKLVDQCTFTINSFSPVADGAKDKLAALLKSNYSIYDEITGAHYISGKPQEMLDKLSH